MENPKMSIPLLCFAYFDMNESKVDNKLDVAPSWSWPFFAQLSLDEWALYEYSSKGMDILHSPRPEEVMEDRN